jgi:hypothetical protein
MLTNSDSSSVKSTIAAMNKWDALLDAVQHLGHECGKHRRKRSICSVRNTYLGLQDSVCLVLMWMNACCCCCCCCCCLTPVAMLLLLLLLLDWVHAAAPGD